MKSIPLPMDIWQEWKQFMENHNFPIQDLISLKKYQIYQDCSLSLKKNAQYVDLPELNQREEYFYNPFSESLWSKTGEHLDIEEVLRKGILIPPFVFNDHPEEWDTLKAYYFRGFFFCFSGENLEMIANRFMQIIYLTEEKNFKVISKKAKQDQYIPRGERGHLNPSRNRDKRKRKMQKFLMRK